MDNEKQAALLAEILEAITVKHAGTSEHKWGEEGKAHLMDDWSVSMSPLFVPYVKQSYPNHLGWATSYSTGMGHRVGYKPRTRADFYGNPGRPKAPDKLDILDSLVRDGQAVDQCFQDWADEYGLNADSIKDKAVYEKCVDIGIKMRSWLDGSRLAILREYFEENPR